MMHTCLNRDMVGVTLVPDPIVLSPLWKEDRDMNLTQIL